MEDSLKELQAYILEEVGSMGSQFKYKKIEVNEVIQEEHFENSFN